MADIVWVHCSSYTSVPPTAVYAGQDSDGDGIYVGRAHHGGEVLPAKVIPNKRVAYICNSGSEITKHEYEVLCGSNFTWVPSSGGSVPPNAVISGHTVDGEPLYIGRGHYEGSLTPGKVHPSHGCLYIPYGGQEIRLDSYEVLISPDVWLPAQGGSIPPNAVFAGQDSNGDPIYVGRAYHDGDLLPAKVIPNKGQAYVAFGGEEVPKYNYEVLCGTFFTWVGSASGHVPQGAVSAGRTSNGEILYVGRGHHEGSLTPGKVHPSHQCLYIPYGGSEVSLPSYEVLVKSA